MKPEKKTNLQTIKVSVDGSNCLVTFKQSETGLYAEIDEMNTKENLRRQGFGTKLLKKVKALAWKKGCYKIILHVRFSNTSALMFYLSNGFKINGLSLRHNNKPKEILRDGEKT